MHRALLNGIYLSVCVRVFVHKVSSVLVCQIYVLDGRCGRVSGRRKREEDGAKEGTTNLLQKNIHACDVGQVKTMWFRFRLR